MGRRATGGPSRRALGPADARRAGRWRATVRRPAGRRCRGRQDPAARGAGRPPAPCGAAVAGAGRPRLPAGGAPGPGGGGARAPPGHGAALADVALPSLPFVDLLRPVAADPALAPAAAGLPALTDLLAGRPGVTTVEGPDVGDFGRAVPHRSLRPAVDDGRLQLFESVAALIGELAAAAPLLIVLEDLHWADRSSRDLLRYLLARLVDERITIVASYRSDDLHRRHPLRPLLAELVRLPVVERLELAPLPDAAVEELVRRLAEEAGCLERSAVEDVVARAEGNAFYAEELLAAGLEGETLPLGLTDVLLARVEQLTDAAQQVLRVAAVAGRRVRHELVAAVSGLGTGELEAALAEAVHHHLLVVSDDGRYRFRHALLREAVLADLLPGERVRLHAAVAAYLTANPSAGTAAERAHHARESNDLPAALGASLEAAAEAKRAGAPAEQLQQLEVALALWPAVPDAAERAGRSQIELLLETAGAARSGGDVHRGIALLRSARDTLGQDGDPLLRARVHYTLAQALIWIDDLAGAHRETSAAMALVPADPPSAERTWAAATHARAAYYVECAQDADAAAEEALAAADALGLDSAWADTAVSVARMHEESDYDAVQKRLAEALTRARRSGDLDVEMRVLFNQAIVSYEAGDLADTLARSTASVDRACAIGIEWSFCAAELRHLQVVAGYMTGDWDVSLAAADQLARVPEMAAHVRAAGLLVQLGRGDPAAADRVAWARSLATRSGTQVMLMITAAAADIDLAGWAGNAATAVRRAEESVQRLAEIWKVDRMAAVRLVAMALSAAADAADAARLVRDSATAEQWVADGERLVRLAAEGGGGHVARGRLVRGEGPGV